MMTITMRQDDDFFVEDQRVTMHSLSNGRNFVLMIGGVFVVPNVDDWTPLCPGVSVQVGCSLGIHARRAKVRVMAEPGIAVLRGCKYRELHKEMT